MHSPNFLKELGLKKEELRIAQFLFGRLERINVVVTTLTAYAQEIFSTANSIEASIPCLPRTSFSQEDVESTFAFFKLVEILKYLEQKERNKKGSILEFDLSGSIENAEANIFSTLAKVRQTEIPKDFFDPKMEIKEWGAIVLGGLVVDPENFQELTRNILGRTVISTDNIGSHQHVVEMFNACKIPIGIGYDVISWKVEEMKSLLNRTATDNRGDGELLLFTVGMLSAEGQGRVLKSLIRSLVYAVQYSRPHTSLDVHYVLRAYLIHCYSVVELLGNASADRDFGIFKLGLNPVESVSLALVNNTESKTTDLFMTDDVIKLLLYLEHSRGESVKLFRECPSLDQILAEKEKDPCYYLKKSTRSRMTAKQELPSSK